MSEKKEKDSYAQDTLAFSVPEEPIKNNNVYPNGRRPQSKYPQQQEQYTYEQYHEEPYYQNQHKYDQYPDEQYYQEYGYKYPEQIPQGQQAYPQGQRPRPQHPQGQRSRSQQPQGQRPRPQQPQGQRPRPQQPQGQRSRSQQPQGQRPRPQQLQKPKPHPQQQQPQGKRRQTQSKRSKPDTSAEKKFYRKKHRTGCLTKILLGLLGILIFVFIIYSVVVMIAISKVNVKDSGERIAPSHSIYDSSNVRNILLIGNDSRGEDMGRSDSMILLSINSSTRKVNMVSLMRDTYVEVPGYGGCKLNAAYSYGGPELLMDTIEENFYIEVDDYISINFTSFAGLVDAVGGVEIELYEEEAEAINVLLDSKEGVSLFGTPDQSDYLSGAGKYKLNGKQALSYARLRKVGNADFERTERQRKVLTELFNNIGVSSVFSALGSAFPDISTNMSKLQMYTLSLRVPFIFGMYDIEQFRLPAEDTYWSSTIDGQDVLEIDIDSNLDIIKETIYGN